jgi:hypothetical protein
MFLSEIENSPKMKKRKNYREMLILFLTPFFFLVLFLVVPFYITLQGGYRGHFYALFSLRGIWGLLKIEYHTNQGETSFFFGNHIIFKRRAEKRDTPVQQKRKERSFPQKMADKIMWLKNIPILIKLAAKFCFAFPPKGKIQGTIGLENPAETGIFLGLLTSFIACLPFPIIIEPNFYEEILLAHGEVTFKVSGIKFLPWIGSAILSRDGRKMIRTLYERRKQWNT